jgi:hypothetical protein
MCLCVLAVDVLTAAVLSEGPVHSLLVLSAGFHTFVCGETFLCDL